MKFAVHNTFQNVEPDADDLGNALNKVMNHPWIRGSSESVHKDLKDLGIQKIVLNKDTLDFVGKSWCIVKHFHP